VLGVLQCQCLELASAWSAPAPVLGVLASAWSAPVPVLGASASASASRMSASVLAGDVLDPLSWNTVPNQLCLSTKSRFVSFQWHPQYLVLARTVISCGCSNICKSAKQG
jgi:hypothetical protein